MVESIFDVITTNQPTCVQSLHIGDCLSVVSFPGDCLPASLKRLHISNCGKLEFPKQQRHELLQSLSIYKSCDSFVSLPLESFPNLKNLNIEICENLELLSVSQDVTLQNLGSFKIISCPNFVSLPIEGLPAPSMTDLTIYDCRKLESLPHHMNTLLPKLKYLGIDNCPEMESFPEGGMPPNLRSLSISICEKLLGGLPSMHMLTHLTHLIIKGPCDAIKSFPKEGLPPASFMFLQLYAFSSLDALDCKGLLPLTSLQQLTIKECPKLENMVGERLPASLKEICISRCRLLEERCQMKNAQIWPKISHIQRIMADGRRVL